MAADELESIEVDGLQARFDLEDVRLSMASLVKADAGSGRFARTYLEGVDLRESKLRAVELIDVILERSDASNGDWGGAQLRRTQFTDARLTGLDLSEALIEHASFTACKLDYANFRHSTIKHVSFDDSCAHRSGFPGSLSPGHAVLWLASSWRQTSPGPRCRVSICGARSWPWRDLCWDCAARSSMRRS